MEKNKIKLILTALIFALVIALSVIAYKMLLKNVNLAGNKTDSQKIEKEIIEAPDFNVQSESGDFVNLSDFRGKAVIVNFWASWCPPCRAELPDFDKLYKEYGDKVQFMMVNMTDGNMETVKSVTKFAKDNSWSFPLFFDTKQSAAKAYRISSIPVTVFIDADGIISDYRIGMLNEESVRAEVEKLLN